MRTRYWHHYLFIHLSLNNYRYHGLTFILLLGVVLGVTQQLRGAHFLSHDIWALAICWFIASIFSPLITARPKA